MTDDPIDDYLQALIGQATETAVPGDVTAASASAPPAQTVLPGQPGDALLAELDAAFDQARGQYEQAQASAPATDSGDALLAELDAAFDQARGQYEQSQASTPAADSGDALLVELDAAFDHARGQYELAQASAPAADSGDALLAELDAAFDQARGQYEQNQHVRPAVEPTRGRIPPAPSGPPVLAMNTSTAQPVWQAAGAAAPAPQVPGQRRRASERSSRWLRLRCGQQPYALELLKVQEVVLLAPLLSLRGTAPHMLGIMNLRGQVVPVMDLGLYLGSEAVQTSAATRIVVLESEGQSLGLRVSAVDDVASLSESQIEPPDTARLCRFSNHLFRGVARLSGPPIILLDANALLN